MTLTPNPTHVRVLRAALLLLALATFAKVWLGPFSLTSEALGQIPDSGAQRKLLIDEARRTNELLQDIKQILTEKTINVRVQSADNPPDAPIRTPRQAP